MTVAVYVYGNLLGITDLTKEQIVTVQAEEGFSVEYVDTKKQAV